MFKKKIRMANDTKNNVPTEKESSQMLYNGFGYLKKMTILEGIQNDTYNVHKTN
jgi:hypothetical protein